MGGGAQVAPLVAAASDWHLGLAWMTIPAALALVLALTCLPRDAAARQSGASTMALLRLPRV